MVLNYITFFKTFIGIFKHPLLGAHIETVTCFTFTAETAQRVIQLNISKTAVTNVGMRNLCYGDDYGQNGMYTYRCPDLIILEVSGTRVTECGEFQNNCKHARYSRDNFYPITVFKYLLYLRISISINRHKSIYRMSPKCITY